MHSTRTGGDPSSPLVDFLRSEVFPGILLVACAVVALGIANSPFAPAWDHFWHVSFAVTLGDATIVKSVAHWINDGLMVLFFFFVGLEIKHEVLDGQLQSLRRAARRCGDRWHGGARRVLRTDHRLARNPGGACRLGHPNGDRHRVRARRVGIAWQASSASSGSATAETSAGRRASTSSMDAVAALAEQIVADVAVCRARPCLIAITGIDACGKGTVAAAVSARLIRQGRRVAALAADDWHAARAVRFAPPSPAESFYQRGLRLDAMFADVIEPLRAAGCLDTIVELRDPWTDAVTRRRVCYTAADVIVVEGVFLLKRSFQPRYDLSYWLDCSFATALSRALQRNQEGQTEAELLADYHAIYFAAQLRHLAQDRPRAAATRVLTNDGCAEVPDPPLWSSWLTAHGS